MEDFHLNEEEGIGERHCIEQEKIRREGKRGDAIAEKEERRR
jgi:hypothetical protein